MYDASIVIPTYNRSRLLELSLVSLLKQDLRDFTFETIIVDDGSTDDTREIVRKYERLLHITYIYQEHIGNSPSKSRNKGIAAATGDIVIFIDSGVVAGKDLVYEHCAANKYNGSCVVIGNVYALYTPLEDTGFDILFDITDIERSLTNLRLNEPYHDYRLGFYEFFNYDLTQAPAPWHFFWTCNVSVPRNVLKGSVLFDENYGCWGMEDVDLGFRVFQEGVPFVFGRYAEVIHVPHSTAAEFSKKNESNQQNTVLFHNTHNCFHSEMCFCANELTLNLCMKLLLDARRFDFNLIKVPGLFQFLDPKSTLVFGGYNEGILKQIPEAHILEYNKTCYESLKRMMPAENIHNYLGVHTPLTDRFNSVFITDYWQYLNEKYIYALVTEALRLGKTIYILLEIAIDKKVALSIDRDALRDLGQCLAALGLNHTIQRFTSYNVGVSVIIIHS